MNKPILVSIDDLTFDVRCLVSIMLDGNKLHLNFDNGSKSISLYMSSTGAKSAYEFVVSAWRGIAEKWVDHDKYVKEQVDAITTNKGK